MPLSMHRASVPLFKQTLSALAANLEKAEAHGAAQSIEQSDFLERRLAPDMFTLTQQIQWATFHAAQAGAKLAGVETPDYEDGETSFADLRQRIAKTIEFLSGLEPAQFDRSEDKELEIQVRAGPLNFIGQDFLLHFAIPQVMFHTTTAYGIMRNAGVEIGKRDFLGDAANR